MEELLHRRLGEEGASRLSDELKQAKWSQLRAMMSESPLVANMVTALASSSATLPRSMTELYTVMVVNMVRRSAAKAERCIVQGALEDIPAGAKATLLSIGKLALDGLRKGRHVFHLEKDVRPTCGELSQLFGLLEEFRTVSLRGECHEAQFLHLTFPGVFGSVLCVAIQLHRTGCPLLGDWLRENRCGSFGGLLEDCWA